MAAMKTLTFDFRYLEQCAFGGVEFSVAFDHSFHHWSIIPDHQQSGAPLKKTQPLPLVPCDDTPYRKSWLVQTWVFWRWRSLQERASPPPGRCGCCTSEGTGRRWPGSWWLWCSDGMWQWGRGCSQSHPAQTKRRPSVVKKKDSRPRSAREVWIFTFPNKCVMIVSGRVCVHSVIYSTHTTYMSSHSVRQ